MTDISGIEFMERLKHQGFDILVLLLTANTNLGLAAVKDTNLVDYKPTVLDFLVEKIEKLLLTIRSPQ